MEGAGGSSRSMHRRAAQARFRLQGRSPMQAGDVERVPRAQAGSDIPLRRTDDVPLPRGPHGIMPPKGMTTFLVTNGTLPEALEKLDPLPTQLYVTLAAPNPEVYKRLCVPRIPDGWERLMRTLELMPSLSTRTVIRHTLVKEWNIGWEDEYARLDALADPTFIEPKGYVFVGDSRRRMRMANMPSHAEIRSSPPSWVSGWNEHPEGEEGQQGPGARRERV